MLLPISLYLGFHETLMSDFDPYLKWLGIRETTRPINHYRLLGLDLFESDPDVISMAADRQMTHVRTYQGGPNGAASQQLLNELARARRCLLVADKKAEYDAQLRAESAKTTPTSVPPPIVQGVPNEHVEAVSALNLQGSVEPGSNIGIQADADARAKTKKRSPKTWISSAPCGPTSVRTSNPRPRRPWCSATSTWC